VGWHRERMGEEVEEVSMHDSTLKPCPFCGKEARYRFEKKYTVMMQDWHDKDEAEFLPCIVYCSCGVTIQKACSIHDGPGPNAAQKKAHDRVFEAWNTRVDQDKKEPQ
jgi:hypothetical protein